MRPCLPLIARPQLKKRRGGRPTFFNMDAGHMIYKFKIKKTLFLILKIFGPDKFSVTVLYFD